MLSQIANIINVYSVSHGPMHIVSFKRLKEFWEAHRDAETPLRAWYHVARKARWMRLVDVRNTYPHADYVGRLTVFNIGGKKYRLIVAIRYDKGRAFIRHVLTHSEYDRSDWKQ